MAHEDALRCISMNAGEDLSTYQYRFVKVHTDGTAKLCGVGEFARGVVQNEPTLGQVASVGIEGESKVVGVSGLAAGDLVASDSVGRATTAGAGNHVNGIAREDCNATGQIVTIGLAHGYKAS